MPLSGLLSGIKTEPSVCFVVPIVTLCAFYASNSFKVTLCAGCKLDCQRVFPVLLALDFPCVLLHLIGPSESFHPRHRLPQRAAQC